MYNIYKNKIFLQLQLRIAFSDFNYGLEVKFKSDIELEKVKIEVSKGHIQEIQKLYHFKEELYDTLIQSTDKEEIENIKEKLAIIECHKREITGFCFSSIFIGILCPTTAAEEDLKERLSSGELEKAVLDAFDINKLKEKHEIESLIVEVKLRKIKDIPRGITTENLELNICCNHPVQLYNAHTIT